jgi:uncharacterized protein
MNDRRGPTLPAYNLSRSMSEVNPYQIIDGLADFFAKSMRTPVLRRPDEYGMDYEDVFFPSLDGLGLEGWFIPADSDRLVVCNHFMPGNRYGYPGHLDPWKGFGGIVAIGLLEYRDVIGSLRYTKSRKDTRDMQTALLSVCLGCDSTMVAMNKHPEEFTNIQALLALQPVSARPFIERASENAGILDGVKMFDAAIHKRTGFHLDELSPIEHAKAVRVPTLVVQVHDDVLTKPSDVQTIYDNISSQDKKLFWIEGTTRRFDGYNYFGEHPELMLDWFNAHMTVGSAASR